MFKPFYLNHDYQFDYLGSCKYKGEILNLKSDKINIEVQGYTETFNRNHVGLFTHFRMNPLVVKFDNVEFVDMKSKVINMRCGKLPVFKEPVELDYGFRIIPGFSNFAINSTGNTLSFRSGTILTGSLNPYGYPCVNIYDPDKERWRSVATHLLLARAFIKNDDPTNKIYVNHIDGDKLNFDLSNLEWVTAQENVTHAIETGLVKYDEGCTIHDLSTGESFNYPSPRLGMKALNIKNNYHGKNRSIGDEVYPRVYGKRYVITDRGFTLNQVTKALAGRQHNVAHRGPYQAYEIGTRISVECKEINDLVTVSGVPYHHVRGIIESATPKKSGGYYFRVKSDEDFPTSFEDYVKLSRREFTLTCLGDGRVEKFPSLSKMCTFLGTDKSTVYRRLRDKKPHKNWLINETTQETKSA